MTYETETTGRKTLNPFTDYADKEVYESSSPQTDRHVDVQRQVRRASACAAGQSGNDNTGTRRKNGHTGVDVKGLGIRKSTTHCHRTAPRTCGSPRSNTEEFTPDGINYCPASPYLTPVFLESGKFSNRFIPIFLGQRNFPKISVLAFQEPNRLFGEFFKYFPKISISPLAKVTFITYNRRYKEWDNFPSSQKNGLEKCSQHFCKPDSKPNVTRFTAGLDCIRKPTFGKGISCKRFIATKERTNL